VLLQDILGSIELELNIPVDWGKKLPTVPVPAISFLIIRVLTELLLSIPTLITLAFDWLASYGTVAKFTILHSTTALAEPFT
jgi:hypothetical protein